MTKINRMNISAEVFDKRKEVSWYGCTDQLNYVQADMTTARGWESRDEARASWAKGNQQEQQHHLCLSCGEGQSSTMYAMIFCWPNKRSSFYVQQSTAMERDSRTNSQREMKIIQNLF